MPTLPDRNSLGARPVAQSSRGVTRIQTGQVEQAAGALGNQVAEMGAEFKRRDDVEKVSTVMTQFEDEQRKFLLEGDDAVLNRSGENAKGSLKGAEDWWEGKSSEYLGRLDNPDQQRAFQKMLQQQRGTVLNSVARHESKQREISFANTLEARINTSTERAAALAGNPEVVQQSKAQISDSLNVIAKSRGWSPEVLAQKRQETLTGFHSAQVDALIEADPEAATAYYKANKGEIGAAQRGKIEDMLEAETFRRKSQATTDGLMAQGLTAEETLAAARQIQDPKERDEVVSRVKARLSERASFAETERAKLLLQVTNYIDETGSTDDIPAKIWGSLSIPERNQFKKYASDQRSGIPVKTDYNTYYELSQMRAEEPGKFRTLDLTKHFGSLGDTERKQVIGWQRDMLEGEASGKDATWISTKNGIVNDALNSMGIDYGKTAGSDEAQRAANFRGAIERKLALWQEENPGKQIQPEEFRALVNRQTIDVKLPGEGWFGTDKSMPLFEAESAPDWYFSGDVGDLPEQDRREIEAALEARNIPATDELILQMYIRANGLNQQPGAPSGDDSSP